MFYDKAFNVPPITVLACYLFVCLSTSAVTRDVMAAAFICLFLCILI